MIIMPHLSSSSSQCSAFTSSSTYSSSSYHQLFFIILLIIVIIVSSSSSALIIYHPSIRPPSSSWSSSWSSSSSPSSSSPSSPSSSSSKLFAFVLLHCHPLHPLLLPPPHYHSPSSLSISKQLVGAWTTRLKNCSSNWIISQVLVVMKNQKSMKWPPRLPQRCPLDCWWSRRKTGK